MHTIWCWLLLLITFVAVRKRRGKSRQPPGPKPWPVVGNIFQLGFSANESLAKLSAIHGPIMTLWLGSMCTIVISSSGAARETFKKHDIALAGRKVYEAGKGDFGNEGSLITSQYGPHWRMLRRLCTLEFFVTSRLDAKRPVRAKCVDQMVKFIGEAGGSGTRAVDVGWFFFLMSFNLIGNLMFSKDLLDPSSERGAEFFYHAKKVMELAGKPNVADFFPALKRFDLQGLRRKMQFHVDKVFDIAGLYLKERMQRWDDSEEEEEETGGRRRDYVDVLLRYLSFCLPELSTLLFYGDRHYNQYIEHEYLPFGSGHRMCPAVPLVARILPLALGSILHLFDWGLPDGARPEELDMGDSMGITLRKAIPLKVIPTPYISHNY